MNVFAEAALFHESVLAYSKVMLALEPYLITGLSATGFYHEFYRSIYIPYKGVFK
jgi:hypothetical protein